MKELTSNQIEEISGGIPPMMAFYAAYVVLGPMFALGVARGATAP